MAAKTSDANATKETRDPPERLLELGSGLAVYRAHIDDLHEQELNARAQSPATFERLKATISRDSRLESLPFCAMVDGRIEIVSGHHRTRAARAGGVPIVFVVVDETGLTRDQIKAKQLAHNAIEGFDEEQLVARIYAQITDVDARLEAFVAQLKPLEQALAPVSLPKLDLDIAYRTVLITFMPSQEAQFRRAVEQISEQVDLDRDHLYLVDESLYAQWQAAMSRLHKEYGAKALSAVVARMIDAIAQVLGIEGRAPEDLDPFAYVPLVDLLGTALVHPDVAPLITAVVDDAIRRKEVTRANRAEVLQMAFGEYAERRGINTPDPDHDG